MNHEKLLTKGDLLIVDDNPHNLRLLATLLVEKGYKVRKAINGQLALTAVRTTHPELILLDINMPEINGFEVCKQLKANPETSEIPIIFLSALNEAVDKVKAFEVGGSDYITKPFQFPEVLARVENQIARKNLQNQLQQQTRKLALQNLILQQEIEERKRVEAEIRFLLTTSKAISNSPDFHAALEVTLRQVCEIINWDFGEAWIPNEQGTMLESSRGWYGRNSSLRKFRQKSEKLTFAPNVGLAGRIWLSQKPEWIEDISNVSKKICIRSRIADEVNLKATFGVPIIVDDLVLAIIVLYKQTSLKKEPHLIELVEAVANQLGSFIQQKKAEAAIREVNQELKRIANIDGLTGVANRRKFDEYLHSEWRRMFREKLPLSLLLCDVDFFKNYNDAYGHLAGDDCLKQVAQALEKNVKRPGDLVTRYGGEEFAIILPNTDAEGAMYVAETIRSLVENLKIVHQHSLVSKYVTLSVGVVSKIPTGDLNSSAFVALADEALYQAKKQGRNQVVQKTNSG
ncbi:MAG: diguanylate cyclase [Oscillatoria sp. PMC 1068.18]|nr:diguanylate cyclase [Oscillatoria sp. PMC 1076.18]MEC4987447.1 diguanylate cyclase [Oscillatoria sp. PMC 1068.18]